MGGGGVVVKGVVMGGVVVLVVVIPPPPPPPNLCTFLRCHAPWRPPPVQQVLTGEAGDQRCSCGLPIISCFTSSRSIGQVRLVELVIGEAEGAPPGEAVLVGGGLRIPRIQKGLQQVPHVEMRHGGICGWS